MMEESAGITAESGSCKYMKCGLSKFCDFLLIHLLILKCVETIPMPTEIKWHLLFSLSTKENQNKHGTTMYTHFLCNFSFIIGVEYKAFL